ncbi:MAG TPA: membrane protein insertase YidC [Syntrophobacteraceae bacterium]|nr:membrane protein insertase YidC [Syntrophobacteraceae bacterium]HBZ55693.1 membrane protein insertase YidC [Syntrophobacteraceae bacterium]
MEKRTLVAFVLSIAVLFLWEVFTSPESSWFRKSPPPTTSQEPKKPVENQASSPPAPAEKPAAPSALPTTQAASTKEYQDTWTIQTPLYETQLTASGARMHYFKLKRFRRSVDPQAPLMDLITTQSSGFLPMALDFVQHSDWELATRAYQSASTRSITLAEGATKQDISFSAEVPDHLRVTKTYTFSSNDYSLDIVIQLQNLGQESLQDQMGISFYYQPYVDKEASSYNKSQFLYYQERSTTTLEVKDIIKKEPNLAAPLQWFGYEDNYFLQAVIPVESGGFQVATRVLDEPSGRIRSVYLTEPFQIEAGKEKTFHLKLFLGPKDLTLLKQAGNDLAAAVDYGWFDFLAKPMLYVLKWFYKYTHNYGVAIILITVIIKIIFWPLTHKSYKSMQGMKKLQPKLNALREKHKDNREKLNEELMGLYRAHKVNPLGGCLPMVLQIPVFFALYRMLYSSVDLLHQPFMLWMNDLTAPDRLPIGFNIPYVGNGLPVLTLLMGASMFIQQKMTPSTGDPRQEKMMLMMPVVFTVMFINFPAGLVLYWLVNNVLSIAQQYWINRQA